MDISPKQSSKEVQQRFFLQNARLISLGAEDWQPETRVVHGRYDRVQWPHGATETASKAQMIVKSLLQPRIISVLFFFVQNIKTIGFKIQPKHQLR